VALPLRVTRGQVARASLFPDHRVGPERRAHSSDHKRPVLTQLYIELSLRPLVDRYWPHAALAAHGDAWIVVATDAGTIAISCTCPINNKVVERLNLTSAGGAFAGALYFAKGNWPYAPYAGHKVTYLVGVRNFSTPDLRVTAARIMGIESDHRTLARVVAPGVAKRDGGPIEKVKGIQGRAESVDPPNNNGYERTLRWTDINQAVAALTPFADKSAAAKAGFATGKPYRFKAFTPKLPQSLGAFHSFLG